MRNISPASLTVLSRTNDVEPVMIVRVFWAGNPTNYCDRQFVTDGLVGKLLQITNIEDVVDIDSSANSVSLSVTLDDSDGNIKNIYNNIDIHGTYVQVLQWFTQLPLSEAFVIYEGVISSPIIWAEGIRTLQFDVVTKLEDREVGFSAEEGQFNLLPSNVVGVPWPIVFGTVRGLKPIPFNEAPSAVLASGFGIVDQDIWEAELDDIRAAMDKLYKQSRDAYALGLANALQASRFKGGSFFPDDPSQAEQYDLAAFQYYSQSGDFLEERIRLGLVLQTKLAEKEQQEALEFRVLPITQTNLPSGIRLTVEIGNYTAGAVVIGNAIALSNLTLKPDVNAKIGTNAYNFRVGNVTDEYKREFSGQKFTWIDGGTQIKVFNFPRYYVLSIGFVNVLNVWARNKFGRAVVPRNWYTVSYEQFGSLHVTKLIFPTPLQSYPGEWLDGDIEVDCGSTEVGTNVVDIMTWVIQRFSSFGIDATSFAATRAYVDPFPANFALTQRMNVAQFLKEVAFQARCSIWLNDRKFFLRFLPVEQSPIETITDSDVEVNSITVTSTETERLITKFVATWRENLNQSEPNKIIYRYNVQKYGIIEETYDFFIYTRQDLVAKAAEFWMIRKSNTWKIIQLKVNLNKLKIEAFDPVQFTFVENLVANGSVTGIVQKAAYNPDDDSISLEAWLPVRLGEMSPYVFAYPGDTSQIYPILSDPNIQTGNPWGDANGDIVPAISFPPHWSLTNKRGNYSFTNGTGTPGDGLPDDPTGSDVITALDPAEIDENRPPGITGFNNSEKREIRPIEQFTYTALGSNTFFGFVRDKINDNLYVVDLYTSGLFQDPTPQQVYIGYIRENSIIPNGYPIAVNRTIFSVTNGTETTKQYEYWAQPPVWYPPSEDEDP